MQNLNQTTNQHLSRLTRYHDVRRFSELLVETLLPEDTVVQSMPDASPTKWHLAHTTWFFEMFILKEHTGYKCFDPAFAVLFNSYYNAIGEQFPRPNRGLLTRPSLEEVKEYRRYVDDHMATMLDSGEAGNDLLRILEIGLHHEQQHQELIVTDLKHALSQNPLEPVFRSGAWREEQTQTHNWMSFDGGVRMIGHEGDGFAFDNETPRHEVLLQDFQLGSHLVTNAEFIQFIDDGGYEDPQYWLSMGWSHVQQQQWRHPLYWRQERDGWSTFTTAGRQPLQLTAPVCHVSYFEADAYARWANARLPTETEWEVACGSESPDGDFLDTLIDDGLAIHPQPIRAGESSLQNAFGSVWEWTASPYAAYPGYKPNAGALGEYNGKFMCNQFILRGGSAATPSDHIRATYRNFFPPDARWQFSGFRLARDV